MGNKKKKGNRKIKAIKIKKKDKRCSYCINYCLFYCRLRPKDEIPIRIQSNGCNVYKRNKNLYF